MADIEYRLTYSQSTVENRAGKKWPAIVGYAACYFQKNDTRKGSRGFGNATEYALDETGTIMERLLPGCFDRCLKALREGKHFDTLGLRDHNKDKMLALYSKATLELKCDDKGLFFRMIPTDPPSDIFRDTVADLRSGDISGASFGFIPGKSIWAEEDGKDIRYIADVDILADVSCVAMPAYLAATSGLERSRGTAGRQIDPATAFKIDGYKARALKVTLDSYKARAQQVTSDIESVRRQAWR